MKNKRHGLTNHRLYSTWSGMIRRCNNPKNQSYKNYGAIGITVCDRWLDINNFIDDMYPSYQEGLTIDRKDNNKGYFKDNCRWATKETQSRNTRKIHSHNTSGFRGVSWSKNANKWRSKIKVNKKTIHIGYFKTAIEAAKARDKYIDDSNLEHTKNF